VLKTPSNSPISAGSCVSIPETFIVLPSQTGSQFGEERAYLELIVGPAHTYIFVKKWESTKKTRWLEQAKDELNELLEHTKMVK
jgi:hypothetical protein